MQFETKLINFNCKMFVTSVISKILELHVYKHCEITFVVQKYIVLNQCVWLINLYMFLTYAYILIVMQTFILGYL